MEHGTRWYDTVADFTSKCHIESSCILIFSIVKHFRVAIIPTAIRLLYGNWNSVPLFARCLFISKLAYLSMPLHIYNSVAEAKLNRIKNTQRQNGIRCRLLFNQYTAQHEMRHGGQAQCDGKFIIVIVTIQRRIKCNRVKWVRFAESGFGIMATQPKDGTEKITMHELQYSSTPNKTPCLTVTDEPMDQHGRNRVKIAHYVPLCFSIKFSAVKNSTPSLFFFLFLRIVFVCLTVFYLFFVLLTIIRCVSAMWSALTSDQLQDEVMLACFWAAWLVASLFLRRLEHCTTTACFRCKIAVSGKTDGIAPMDTYTQINKHTNHDFKD